MQVQLPRAPRLLLPNLTPNWQTVTLPPALYHYVRRVLRLNANDTVRVWNGAHEEWLGQIRYPEIDVAEIVCVGDSPYAAHWASLKQQDNLPALWVLQALPEGDKMDWVIEKCTELGAAGFIPVQAERSVVRLNAERSAKRLEHWRKVMEAAAIQCERPDVPKLLPPVSLSQALAQMNQQHEHKHTNPKLLWCTPSAPSTLESVLKHWLPQPTENSETPTNNPTHQPPDVLYLAVGPEGGWTETETQQALTQGQTLSPLNVRWGSRILRTETFAMALMAYVQGFYAGQFQNFELTADDAFGNQ